MVWFNFLKEQGLFDPSSNPDPIPVDDGFKIPYWDSLAYIEKLATQIGEGKCLEAIPEILVIIENVCKHPKDNYMTWYAFMKILRNIPNVEISESLLHYIPTWFRTRFDTMSQSNALYEDLLPKFLNDKPSEDDIKKAEIILRYVFMLFKQQLNTEAEPEESYHSLLHSYTLKEIADNNELHIKIVRFCSPDIIWQVVENIRLLLFDYPQGILELVKSGEINYSIRILVEGNRLNVKWKIHTTNEEEKVLGTVQDYESKNKNELTDIFNSLLRKLPTEPDSESLTWSAYRIAVALKVDMFSSIVHHPIHELEIEGYNKLTETFAYLLRQLLKALAKEKPRQCKDLMERLVNDNHYHYPFFLRIVFYMVAEAYDSLKEIFWKLVGPNDPEHFLSEDMYYPDITYLLEKNGDQFTDSELSILQNIIDQGNKDELYKNKEKYQEYWRFGWYTSLQDVPYFKNTYVAYSKKLNSTGESYKDRNRVKVRVGFVTPYTVLDLLELSVEEIVERIKHFESGDQFDGPSIEGFAETIGKVVEEDPVKFAERIDLFKYVPVTYINSIIYALHNAWKNKKHFDWKPVLQFLNAYVDEGILNPTQQKDEDYMERINPKILTGSIAWLITEGCRDEKNSFEDSVLPIAKEILFKLVPFIQPEERKELINADYPTYSYNTSNGKILRAVLDYALAFARTNSEVQKEKRWPPDAEAIFNFTIDQNIIEGYIFLGMYYEQLYYLDQYWIQRHVDSLQAIDDERWEAFLGGLAIARIPFNENVYHWLFVHYQKAIEKEKILIGRHHQGGLLLHVLAFYFRDYEGMTPDSLTGQVVFYAKASIIINLCGCMQQQVKYLVQYPEEERNELRKKVFHFWRAVLERFREPSIEEELELYENLLRLGGYVDKLNSETAELFAKTIERNNKQRYIHSFLDDLIRLHEKEPVVQTAYYLSLILSKIDLPDYLMDDDKKKFTTLIRFLYEHGQCDAANATCNRIAILGHNFLRSLYREFNQIQG